MKKFSFLAAVCALLVAAAPALAATELSVFAAASMNESMTEIAEMYKKVAPDVSIVYNFDSSGTLKTQIEQGAECDIFISAGQKQMDQINDSHVMPGTRFNIVSNKVVLIVPKGNNPTGIASFDALAGKNVITQVDSAAYNVLAGEDATQAELAATFGNLETIGEYNTAFMQLESGAVDAVACDLSIAAYQLAAKPDAYVQLDEFLSEEHYAVGFKKGDDATADAVNEALRAMDEDGFVAELCDKYAADGISYDNWCLE